MSDAWQVYQVGTLRLRWVNRFGFLPVAVVLKGSVVQTAFYGPFAKRRGLKVFNSILSEEHARLVQKAALVA